MDAQQTFKRPSRLFGQHIIKHRLQFKFSFIVFIFLSFAIFVIWLEGRVATNFMVQAGMITDSDAVLQLKRLNSAIANTGILAMAVTFGLALFFSHFIAGPIYRFEKMLEAMRGGNLTVHVKLRKFDELKEVADLFNQTLASLRVKLTQERAMTVGTLEKISKTAADLRSSGNAKAAEELDAIVEQAKKNPPQITI